MNSSVFLIMFIAFIALMGLVPFLLRRFGIPAVISLLLVGMLIGENGFGINLISNLAECLSFLSGETSPEVTASYFTSLVNALGSLGLMFLMALAGMEADFKLIRSARRPVIALSLLTFLVPAVAGYFVYRHFLPHDLPGKLLYASLFASHSVGIVFPVIRELKLSQTRFGAAVLISTVITDISSIILLAVSVQLFRQNGTGGLAVNKTLSLFDHFGGAISGNAFIVFFLSVVVLYLVLTVLAVNFLSKKLLQYFQPGEDMLITIILLIILASVVVGELFGINLVVGAFIAGLGLSRAVQQEDMLVFRRFESIGYGFLIPFLFVSIGMKTDFAAFSETGNWRIVLYTVLFLVLSKICSGYIAMRLSGFSRTAGLAAGLMTVPQLSATLAAAAIGKDLGILDDKFFNAIIILSIVTTLPVPSLVRLVVTRGKLQPHAADFEVPQVVREEELL